MAKSLYQFKVKTSVLIVTRNRSKDLEECLTSLTGQTIKPYEVIVVNNEKTNIITPTPRHLREKLNILYFQETKKGTAFARNTALRLAKGAILTFVDDDCSVNKNWLKNILADFEKYSQIDGVLGKAENFFKSNVYANVFQCYYLRWLMENFKDINKPQLLSRKNNFFDTKNIAFKRKIIKNFSFDPDVLYHSINVDMLAGRVLLKKANFLYDPGVIVYHKNPSTLKYLLVRNFIRGIASQLVIDRKKIDIRKSPLKCSFFRWLRTCCQEVKALSFFKKIIFWFILFFYPVPYKMGGLAYKIGFYKGAKIWKRQVR